MEKGTLKRSKLAQVLAIMKSNQCSLAINQELTPILDIANLKNDEMDYFLFMK